MIPLSRWLAQQDDPEASQPPSGTTDDVPEAEISQASEQHLIAEDSSLQHAAREEELCAVLAAAEERAAELSAALAQREVELKAAFAEDLADRLAAGIGGAFDTLLRKLEDALAEVLTPFLTREARDKAMAELQDILARELREADEPVLALKAPAELHDRLETLRPHLAVSTALVESDRIEIVFAGRRLRFEEMSSRWCSAIKGEDP